MALLDIRNLNIEIQTPNGRMKIVDGVNLSLNEGEILGLVGESGSGKSLIAKVISNSIKDNWIVTADRFRFNDVELLKLTPNQRRKIVGKEISMIFQNPLSCLDPSRKIGKQLIQSIPNWTFKGRWWQWFGWKKRRAIELLHRVGIKDHQDIMASYPNELTEGEGQKVMIAVAVANQPRLLIADEPTNSLESITALQIFRLLSSMNQNQGTTILLASNDLKSISEWCDSISVLYCGQNTESGPTDQILEMPHHPYTQALLYSVPDFSRPLGFKSKLGTLEGTVPILEQMPIGCRLGPRCPFAQRECIQKPSRYRIKQHEFSCHHPINLRERQFKDKIATSPLTLNTESKSTLVKMIAGITPPASGKILFNDLPLQFEDFHYRAQHIRMVFQDANSAFNPRLNIGQALDAPLRLITDWNEETRNEKIFETLSLVGLYPDYTNLKIKHLSVSQKQRIALARALILQPEIIIIDDALSTLDASVRIQLLNLILDLQEHLGISYIYVGQNLGIIKHIADQVLVMDEGEIIESGTPREIFTNPQNNITRLLVESHFGQLLDENAWQTTTS